MGLIATNKGGNFTLAPEGTHVAVCVSVIDLGLQRSEAFNNEQEKVHIAWEIAGEKTDDGKPLLVSKRYTSSTNEKAALRKDLESWRGKAFSKAEIESFDIRTILGVPCLLNIVHKTNGDKTYANVKGVMALPKGTAKPKADTKPVSFDLNNWDQIVYESLPDFLKKAIDGRIKSPVPAAANADDAGGSITDKDIPFSPWPWDGGGCP